VKAEAENGYANSFSRKMFRNVEENAWICKKSLYIIQLQFP